MLIPMAIMQAQLDRYAGWTYAPEHAPGERDCRYPTPVPGVAGILAPPPTQADCCTFAEGFLVGSAALAGHIEWGRAFHNRMMIRHATDRFGPVDALVDAGLAVRLELDALWPLPAIFQGWGPAGGHTAIIWERRGDKLLRLECSRSQGGVVWRDVGRVTSSTPPYDWDLAANPWTVKRLRKAYPELAVAALRVG